MPFIRTSAELVALLSDCELVSRMQSSLLTALCDTQDDTAIESIKALVSKVCVLELGQDVLENRKVKNIGVLVALEA